MRSDFPAAVARLSEGFCPPHGRTCLKCGENKARDHFRLVQGRYLNSYCKLCDIKRLKVWKEENPEASRASNRKAASGPKGKRRYQARMEWLRAGDVTASQLKALVIVRGYKCHYCGCEVRVKCYKTQLRGFDHVVPRAKGGRHTIDNLVVCCWDCNRTKRDQEAPK